MKWFQHYSDSHNNPKIKQIIRKYGMEGLGFWWLCCELLAKDGKKYRLEDRKQWKTTLAEISKIDTKKIQNMLEFFGNINSINKKSLNRGHLYIPKMSEYSDDYTNRVRRVYEHSTNNVRQDKIRVDKNRIDNIAENKFSAKDMNNLQKVIDYYLELTGKSSKEYKKHLRPAKELLNLCDDNVDKAKQILDKCSKESFGDWSLYWAVKKWLEFK